MIDTMPDLSKAPPKATHWAPESDDFLEAWYRWDGESWRCINAYWADEVISNPDGRYAFQWFMQPHTLRRPIEDLIELEQLATT